MLCAHEAQIITQLRFRYALPGDVRLLVQTIAAQDRTRIVGVAPSLLISFSQGWLAGRFKTDPNQSAALRPSHPVFSVYRLALPRLFRLNWVLS
jgi:hypothetical protein